MLMELAAAGARIKINLFVSTTGAGGMWQLF
jgi:hypothetical protein